MKKRWSSDRLTLVGLGLVVVAGCGSGGASGVPLEGRQEVARTTSNAAYSGPAVATGTGRARSLYSFDGASGYDPAGGVITDHGVVYGTTAAGGTGPCFGGSGCGTVFSLTPPSTGGGPWGLEVLYDFQGGQDGESPAAQLTAGPDGTLFGYPSGGTNGTVFELSPPATSGQPWTFQILYVFGGGADGVLNTMTSPLVYRRGALFGIAGAGVAKGCGSLGCGSVFRLEPGAAGALWTKKTLFTFTGGATSGEPSSVTELPGSEALYVSTALGDGAIVEIAPPASDGEWSETVLVSLAGGADGKKPGNLVAGPGGSLYGLADFPAKGDVFQLAPPGASGEPWTFSEIGAVSDHGYFPVSLASGGDGTLVGVIGGDPDFFAGSVFQLAPPPSGTLWTYAELWDFDKGPDRNPVSVVRSEAGHLFGVLSGGDSSNGSAFEIF